MCFNFSFAYVSLFKEKERKSNTIYTKLSVLGRRGGFLRNCDQIVLKNMFKICYMKKLSEN